MKTGTKVLILHAGLLTFTASLVVFIGFKDVDVSKWLLLLFFWYTAAVGAAGCGTVIAAIYLLLTKD